MKKKLLPFIISLTVLITLGVTVHYKIQSAVESNTIKSQVLSMYEKIDFPGEMDINAVSLVFGFKLRIRLKKVTLMDKETGFSFEASRVDAYIPYFSFITDRKDKIKIEIDRLEFKTVKGLKTWLNFLMERKKDSNKLAIPVPTYLVAQSYDVKFNEIKFLDQPNEIPTTLILRSLGKEQKLTYEIKAQKNTKINQLDIQTKSTLVGEATIDQNSYLNSKFKTRSNIQFVSGTKKFQDEVQSEGNFQFHPQEGTTVKLKAKGEKLKGELDYSFSENFDDIKISKSNLPLFVVLGALECKSEYFKSSKLELKLKKINQSINLDLEASDKNNSIKIIRDQSKLGFEIEIFKDTLSILKSDKDRNINIENQYWATLDSSRKLSLIEDLMKLVKGFNLKKLKILTNTPDPKLNIIFDRGLNYGPCLLPLEQCLSTKFKSNWSENKGDWFEMIIQSKNIPELLQLPFFEKAEWMSIFKELSLYLNQEGGTITKRLKGNIVQSKLTDIPYFKEKYIEFFKLHKNITFLMEGTIVGLTEAYQAPDLSWVVIIPITHKKLKYRAHIYIGKYKLARAEIFKQYDWSSFFEETE